MPAATGRSADPATVGAHLANLSGMSIRRQTKAAPMPPGGQPAIPSPTMPEQVTPDAGTEQVEQHEWAGDLYEEGDETEPGGPTMFASFQGQVGEEAWLDRTEDGTLTGWVRDADGSVYRYTDPKAWAVDVDDATMGRTDGGQSADPAIDPAAGPEGMDPADPASGAGVDPAADPAAEPVDPFAPAPEEVLAEDPTDPLAPAESDVDPDAEMDEGLDPIEGEDPAEVDPEADPDEDEDEDEDDGMPAAFKKKMQGKAFQLVDAATLRSR